MENMHDGERVLFTDVCRSGSVAFPDDPGWSAVAASLVNQGLLERTEDRRLVPTEPGWRVFYLDDPQGFLDMVAAEIREGKITEREGRHRWGQYNTARKRASA